MRRLFFLVVVCVLLVNMVHLITLASENLPVWYPNTDGSKLSFPLKEGDYATTKVTVWIDNKHKRVEERPILTSWFYYKRNDMRGKIYGAINIPAKDNTPIYAITSGNIIQTGYDKYNGMFVAIKSKSGLIIYYEHLSNWNVLQGWSVTEGEMIGYTGRTGRTTGTNLRINAKYEGEDVCISNYFGVKWVCDGSGGWNNLENR